MAILSNGDLIAGPAVATSDEATCGGDEYGAERPL